jgi:phenylacetate-CoA ligase
MSSFEVNQMYYALQYPFKIFVTSLVAYIKHRQKYGRYFRQNFDFLMSNDIKDQQVKANEELEEFQAYLKKNSRFYGNQIPQDLDIKKMPVIDKDVVLKNYQKIVMQKAFKVGRSSGTTGQSLAVPYAKNVYQKEYAFWWYHRTFAGIKMGDKIATVAGHKIADVNRDVPPFWVFNAAENQMFFSSYHLSLHNLRHYIDKLNHFRPDFIHGYPSSIYVLAKYVLENNTPLYFVPKMIVTSSEATLDFQRQVIEEAFKSKVYIWYGNTEHCGHITECPYGRLHVQPYHSLVRVVREDGKDAKTGEVGRIVATNFSNYAFPLINYDTKDIVKISRDQKCQCNKGGVVIDYIQGRIEDYILTPEGRTVVRLGHLFKDTKHVRNAHIEQNNIDQIIIRIEKEKGYSSEIETMILKEARSRLGDTIEITFEYVNEIKKEKNGKFRFIIQNINRRNHGEYRLNSGRTAHN